VYKGREEARGLLVWGLQLNVRIGDAKKKKKVFQAKQGWCPQRGECLLCQGFHCVMTVAAPKARS